MDWLSWEESLSSTESCLNCCVISQWLKLQDQTRGTNRCQPELDLSAPGSTVTRHCARRLNESRHWPFLLLPCFGTLALWQARSFFGGGQRGTSCNGKTATCQSELAVPLWWVKKKKKKRITLGVEKLRRVWDGSCISGQKKKYIYIRTMETWTGCCGFSPDRKSQLVSCLLADSVLNGSNLY